MREIIRQTTTTHANGGVETVTEFAGGVRITSFALHGADEIVASSPAPVWRRGSDGFRRGVRIIDGKVERGEITAAEGDQLEEDLITKFDREGW